MKQWWIPALVTAACSGPTATDTRDPQDSSWADSATPEVDWSMLADRFGDGVLLSAWTDGEEAVLVGGDLHGGEAMLARYRDGTLCVEPSPAERALWWIHGPRDGEWYAVGDAGVVLHEVDGDRTREDIPTKGVLFGVYAAADGFVWAVGGDATQDVGEIWRRDLDGTWSAFATGLDGVVFKVWKDWFVGSGPPLRLEEGVLVPHPTPSGGVLTTVRGRDADDVWAVGGTGEIVHWDGTGWTSVDNDFLQPVMGVWTGAGEDVWVAGAYGITAHLDDDGWHAPEWPITGEHFHAVWPHGEEMLFVGGNFYSTTDSYATVARYGPPTDPIEPGPCD